MACSMKMKCCLPASPAQAQLSCCRPDSRAAGAIPAVPGIDQSFKILPDGTVPLSSVADLSHHTFFTLAHCRLTAQAPPIYLTKGSFLI